MNRDLRVVRFIVVYIGISCDHLHFCVLNLSDLYVCCRSLQLKHQRTKRWPRVLFWSEILAVLNGD